MPFWISWHASRGARARCVCGKSPSWLHHDTPSLKFLHCKCVINLYFFRFRKFAPTRYRTLTPMLHRRTSIPTTTSSFWALVGGGTFLLRRRLASFSQCHAHHHACDTASSTGTLLSLGLRTRFLLRQALKLCLKLVMCFTFRRSGSTL